MISSLKSKFDILPRRLLLIGSDKLAVYHWNKGRITQSYLFDTEETGRQQFERYMAATAADNLYILIDVAEEEFRQEMIPHVFGSDREAVLERKQGRLFRNSQYYYSEIQDREKEGRRDDQVLLTAITNTALVKPWLEIIEKYKVPIACMTSIALFSSRILNLIPGNTDKMLLVSLQSISGMRQSFFSDGKLKMSRIVKMPRYGTTPYAPIMVNEMEKIQRYLASLRLVEHGERMNVFFLNHGEMMQSLKKDLQDTESVKYNFIDLNQLALETGLEEGCRTPFAEYFFIYHTLKLKPANQYAVSSERRYFTMRRLRHVMYAASVLLLLGGLGLSGWNFMKALSLKQDSLAAEKKTEFYNQRYQLAREGLPETPILPSDLKTVVDIASSLKNYKTSPKPVLVTISKGLNRFPEIMVNSINWQQAVDPNFDIVDNSPAPMVQPMGMATNLMTPQAGQETGALYYHIANIDARLANFDGDFRGAISTIHAFAEEIRNMEAVENVSVTSLPLDISSESSLKGNVNAVNNDALFSIRIAIGVDNESS